MRKPIDLTGKKFGKLLVIKQSDLYKNNRILWVCKCDCGNEYLVRGQSLRSGKTTHCGCNRHKYLQDSDQNKIRLRGIWRGMKGRCYNRNHRQYKNWGGRGIGVCVDWLNNFENFYNWAISNGYNEDLTLDRIDVDKNYGPDNCRWVTMKEQCSNKTNNIILSFKGETKTLPKWALEYDIPRRVLYRRLTDGWSVERALTTPVENYKTKKNH